jgi:excisionase family DNA binding protein
MVLEGGQEHRVAWSIEDAARATGISKSTMRRAIDQGKLPVSRIGRRVVISDETLHRFVQDQSTSASERSRAA